MSPAQREWDFLDLRFVPTCNMQHATCFGANFVCSGVFLEKRLVCIRMLVSYDLCDFQGEIGFRGLPGLPGPPGEGLQGPPVRTFIL